MMDPVISQYMAQVESVAQPETFQGPGQANPMDVERFDAAMSQPEVAAVSSVDQAVVRPASESNPTFLDGLDRFSAENSKMHETVMNSLSRAGEMGDMFNLQFQVATLTTSQTMIGQTGQKGSQGIQTLLKGQ